MITNNKLYADADHVEELREPRQVAELERLDKIKAQQELNVAKVRQAQKQIPTLLPTAVAPSTVSPASPLPSLSQALPAAATVDELPVDKQGDQVLENGKLFIRDALFTRLFADAIKSGDSGIVILVLKIWSAAYRGSGRSKYAHEMLHLLHNLINIWSKELR